MMKPKAPSEHEDGMLEFLEDIIGSSRFKVPIDQLAKRVEELNELRGEKVSLCFVHRVFAWFEFTFRDLMNEGLRKELSMSSVLFVLLL